MWLARYVSQLLASISDTDIQLAVAFSYFETLQQMGNKQKFQEEEVRLKSLANYLHEVGFQEHQYEDFAEDMFDLLRETATTLDSPDGGAAILSAFNDPNRSMSILTYLKVRGSVLGIVTLAHVQPGIDERLDTNTSQ